MKKLLFVIGLISISVAPQVTHTQEPLLPEITLQPAKIITPQMEAEFRAHAIKDVESQGRCGRPGLSGERGCYQIMPGTWKGLSKKHLGQVKAMTVELEEKVVLAEMLELTLKEIPMDRVALMWNAGPKAKKCSKGVNSHGVPYNSCTYIKKVLISYQKQLTGGIQSVK